ncbi:LOW QUALITY PROTEIN: mas-related G-protein coupled receptor member E [Loxodonta africana]|uniref:LOW QUALITY PROTEIN: mas-related G-protein coupled receptor member E n=1 Tax=Loxodonta africana TaxID=9785 RepID=UPI0030D2F325
MMDPRRPGQQSEFPPISQEDAAFNLVILCLTEALSLGGLLGNRAVLGLLGSDVYQNPSAIYLLGVACTDLLFLSCHVVAIVPDLVQGHLAIPDFMQTSLASLQWSCYLVGLGLLAAVSMEQCLSAFFPTWHPCRHPRCLTTCVSTLTGALGLLLHLLLSCACTQLSGKPSASLCPALWLLTATLFGVLSVAASVCGLVPLLWRERGAHRHQPCGFPTFVLLSVLLSFFCGLPFGVYWLSQSLHWHVPPHFYHLSLLMAVVDRAAKPMIFFCLPYQTLPYQTLPYKALAYQTLPHETVPYKALPHETLPYKALPHQTLTYKALPHETCPYQTLPHETLPYEALPLKTLPFETLPDKALPFETLPYEALPNEALPYETLPHETFPYKVLPFETFPCEVLPCETLPYQILPCEALPYETLHFEALPYETLPHETLRHEALPCETLPFEALPYEALPHKTLPYKIFP